MTIVAHRFVAFGLFRFDDAEQGHRQKAAYGKILVCQDEHIDRIAVLGTGAGDEVERERKSESGRKNAR